MDGKVTLTGQPQVHLFSSVCSRFFASDTDAMGSALFLYRCPVCIGQSFRALFTLNSFYYWKCRSCGFIFANPRLDHEGSECFYNSAFYNAALESEYWRVRKGEKYYTSSTQTWLMKDIVSALQRHLAVSDSILDLGCGGGALLHMLRDEYGFTNLTGVDLNAKAASFAEEMRGLTVEHADVLQWVGARSFRGVLSIESLEHMADPLAYLQMITALLSEDGIVVLTTPYNDWRANLLFRQYGDHYMAPNHVNFFNAHTIRLILARAGLEVVELRVYKARRGWREIWNAWTTRREWLTYDPPLTGPHAIAVPNTVQGDVASWVRARFVWNPAEGESPPAAEVASESRLSPWRRFRSWVHRVLSWEFNSHMLVVVRKVHRMPFIDMKEVM